MTEPSRYPKAGPNTEMANKMAVKESRVERLRGLRRCDSPSPFPSPRIPEMSLRSLSSDPGKSTPMAFPPGSVRTTQDPKVCKTKAGSPPASCQRDLLVRRETVSLELKDASPGQCWWQRSVQGQCWRSWQEFVRPQSQWVRSVWSGVEGPRGHSIWLVLREGFEQSDRHLSSLYVLL